MPGNAIVTRRNNCNFEFEFLGPTALSGIFYDAVNAGDGYFCLRRPEMYDS